MDIDAANVAVASPAAAAAASGTAADMLPPAPRPPAPSRNKQPPTAANVAGMRNTYARKQGAQSARLHSAAAESALNDRSDAAPSSEIMRLRNEFAAECQRLRQACAVPQQADAAAIASTAIDNVIRLADRLVDATRALQDALMSHALAQPQLELAALLSAPDESPIGR